jgi:hypothetical protein
MIRKTVKVVMPPIELMIALRIHPGSLRRSHLRTIPICEIVNDIKTPTAYMGSNLWVSPLKSKIKTDATAPSTIIPLEYTSRSPKLPI